MFTKLNFMLYRELEVTSTGIDMETIGSLGGSTLCQQEVLSLLNNNHVTLIPEAPSEEQDEGLDDLDLVRDDLGLDLVPPGSPPPPYMEICDGEGVMYSGQEVMTSRQEVMTSTQEVMTSRQEVMTSRQEVMTSRQEVIQEEEEEMHCGSEECPETSC